MKTAFHILLTMLFVFGSVAMCGATKISTSATGSLFGDNYGYTFEITDSSDSTIFHAVLKNTSYNPDPVIDKFAFNMDAIMGTHFYISNTVPNWTITDPTGNAIQFDYVGSADSPSDKLDQNDTLAFNFNFDTLFVFPTDPFSLWLDTNGSRGVGIGGGEDFGQVAVSFQTLGANGDYSDLLASNWESGANPQYIIPEPATMLLLGSGLIGFAVSGKKRFKKRNR